jgi:hypothetical protein
MLKSLSAGERNQLLHSMRAIETLLGERDAPKVPYVIRPPQPGDIGWITHRQGVLYNQEYGWDERFEALIAEIAAKFFQTFDPKRERCWIAERDGEVIGSVFCVKESKTIARLRLLYVEPSARGLGSAPGSWMNALRSRGESVTARSLSGRTAFSTRLDTSTSARDFAKFQKSRTTAMVTTSSARPGS